MRDFLSTVTGKSVRQLARLRGGGSALPGLVVERLDPGYLSRVLGRLPYGVVAVSGTNGKTTTTKMIVEVLESQGLKVFTNKTGSNFSRGVVAAALQENSITGKLNADIAVLELDEAHAMFFIERVKPRHTLLLNVLRDQLDRFGEIDTTAKLLQRIADATTDGVVVNREDPLLFTVGQQTERRAQAQGSGLPRVQHFGLSDELRSMFPNDDDFHRGEAAAVQAREGDDLVDSDVTLVAVGDHEATFEIEGVRHRTALKLEGLYNLFNAAAALATVRMVLADGPVTGSDAKAALASASAMAASDAGLPAAAAAGAGDPSTSSRASDAARGSESTTALLRALAEVRPAFGRGEQLELDGQPLELVLVKNPSGFRLGLASFDPVGVDVMIAINDQYADGRDMSWLWDVDFTSLRGAGVHSVSGARAWDMALRLEHDDVPVSTVTEDLDQALTEFRAQTGSRPRRIYCTYTAMLALRKTLAGLTDVEDVW